MKIIKINGDEYRMKMGIAPLAEFEELAEKPVSAMGENPRIRDLIYMFHCALVGGGRKDMTLAESEELVEAYAEEEGIEALATVLGEVVSAAMGKQKKGQKKAPRSSN